MSRFRGTLFGNPVMRTTVAISCALLLPVATSMALADSYPSPQAPQPGAPQNGVAQNAPPPLLAPDQLDNLVSPIALYPDPLLGQILAASTYPLELVEAQQWLQQNRNLQGQALVEAAQQQGWDPSVQVLVAFPDLIAMLNRDVRWTTDLGNAFLAQQADVMNAIQTLRVEARNNGRLATTPQQVVSTDVENGQSAVRIEPANPQVIYPPVYDPAYVWGPPAVGAYPAVSYYPAGYGYGYGGYGPVGYGYGFGSGINIAGLFSGLLSFASWGWGLGWFTHSLSLLGAFFNILGFHGFGGGYGGYAGYGVGRVPAFTVWAHDPGHRLGVPYPRGFVPLRSAGLNSGFSAPGRAVSPRLVATTSGAAVSRALSGEPNRSVAGGYQRFGGAEQSVNRAAVSENRGTTPAYRSGATPYGSPQSYRSTTSAMPQRMASTGYEGSTRTAAAPAYSQRSYAQAPQPQQRYSAPRASSSYMSQPSSASRTMASQKYSAPKYSAPKYSAPKYSAPKAPKNSAPKNSGGHSSGKSSHKH